MLRSGKAGDGQPGLEEAVLSELKETLARETERASSIKWGVGTRHVLESGSDPSEAQLRSNCGITRALVAGLVDSSSLSGPICRATHLHESAIAGSQAIANAVSVGLHATRALDESDVSFSISYQKLVERAIDLAVSAPYNEEEEFELDLQQRFKGRFGSDASSSCAVAAAVFSVHRTIHSLPSLDVSSREYLARIDEISKLGLAKQKQGMALNTLGNSNRLDSASLFSSLAPSIEQDLPVALAVGWAISLGGDVRSNACLAGGIAGAIWGEEGIPEEWLMFSQGVQEGRLLAEELFEFTGTHSR